MAKCRFPVAQSGAGAPRHRPCHGGPPVRHPPDQHLERARRPVRRIQSASTTVTSQVSSGQQRRRRHGQVVREVEQVRREDDRPHHRLAPGSRSASAGRWRRSPGSPGPRPGRAASRSARSARRTRTRRAPRSRRAAGRCSDSTSSLGGSMTPASISATGCAPRTAAAMPDDGGRRQQGPMPRRLLQDPTPAGPEAHQERAGEADRPEQRDERRRDDPVARAAPTGPPAASTGRAGPR